MKSIRDFETKGGYEGTHTLSYGSLGEHQAEMMMEEQVENLEDDKELEQLEQKAAQPKEKIEYLERK